MKIAADAAFLVFIAGIGGITLELARPGYVLPGVLGAGAALAGSYLLCVGSNQPAGLAIALCLAGLLLAAEWWSPVRAVSGVAAMLVLFVAFWLFSNVHAGMLLAGTSALGSAILYLVSQARRARQNKAV